MRITFSELSGELQPEWEKLSADPHVGHMHQCLWWAEPLSRFGISTRVIAGWSGGRLVGGALFRSFQVPVLRMNVTECLNGPLFLEWRDEWAAPFMRAVKTLGGQLNSITVGFRACPSTAIHRGIADAAAAGGMKLRVGRGEIDGVLSLQNRSIEQITKDFKKGARWSLKRALAGPLRVSCVTTDEDLYAAYETWMATAKRKRFADVRPWPALKPVLRQCIDSGNGIVVAAFHESTLVASAFVTLMGGSSYFVYGGYVDGAEALHPNHLIQQFAIQESLSRGLKTYSFGSLSPNWNAAPTGVDLFKLSLGAVAVPQLDTLTWERRPLTDRAVQWSRRQKFGRKLTPLVKRWVMARGSRPPAREQDSPAK